MSEVQGIAGDASAWSVPQPGVRRAGLEGSAMTPFLTGAPTRNPDTDAKRYTGAEFARHLWEVNRTSSFEILPEPQSTKPTRKRAARRPKR
jgi:hypothetical protein